VFVAQTQGSPSTAVPGAPRQLAAAVNGSSVTFTWSPPDTGGAPTTYVLVAGSASGQSNIANFATGSTSTTFSANGVPGGVYFVRVGAQNAVGAGPVSNEVTFSVGQQPSCSAAPPSALQSTVNGSLVTLNWSAAAGGATSYLVEAGSSPSLSNLASVNTGSSATTFTANAPPGTYFVRVRAVTSCGVSSPTSDVTIVVP
jgi:predicted phage tail protein